MLDSVGSMFTVYHISIYVLMYRKKTVLSLSNYLLQRPASMLIMNQMLAPQQPFTH